MVDVSAREGEEVRVHCCGGVVWCFWKKDRWISIMGLNEIERDGQDGIEWRFD